MKATVGFFLAFVAIAFSNAEDDGQYHPEIHGGDDGRYRPTNEGKYYGTSDGRYDSLFDRNGKYNSIYAGYPQYYRTLNQGLVYPYVKYGDGGVSSTTLAPVTYRPIVLSTPRNQPLIYATTPKPIIYAKTQNLADGNANIVRQDSDIDINSYHYLYETDNGIAAEETGSVDPSTNVGGTKARGFFEYIGDDGIRYRVDYVADENGFQPSGAHLP